MFDEFTFLRDRTFGQYFGFTEEEVKILCNKNGQLEYNDLEIRDEVISMVAGDEIDITIKEEFRAGQDELVTKKEIYSAMIILGFLSYYDGYLKVPNKELMQEFEKALADESFTPSKKEKRYSFYSRA
ncbi:hypothetical protein [Clostridium sp.]|uniref:hypothetical protein n=1 Tax=Clostridium sp. TaxID=1506 RepID=UPI003F405475